MFSPGHVSTLSHAIEPGLAICFTYDNIHVSMLFSQIIPPSHSPIESKRLLSIFCCSVQFSRSVVSDSLRPHQSQHARPPCPSPSPGVHSNSGPSSQWCHPAISSCVIPFSSCPQPLTASESFPMSQLFTWGSQSTGVSALNHSFHRTPRTDLL